VRIGRNYGKTKALIGMLGLGIMLFGWFSCSGEKEASSGSLGLQIVFPQGVGPSSKGLNEFSKIEDWSIVNHFRIGAYTIVDNDYLHPQIVGQAELLYLGDHYVDLDVIIFTPAKIYFEVHAYHGMGAVEDEVYRGYAVEIIDPGVDNTVTVMMMPDLDGDDTFAMDPRINYLDPFFTAVASRTPDCNDANPFILPWITELACSDGLDNDCDGLIDSMDPDCSLGISMEFVHIEPGTFMMGSYVEELGRSDDEDYHEVTLTIGFHMQTTEFTQAQWAAVITAAEAAGLLYPGELDKNPSYPPLGDNIPVNFMTWYDIQTFISALNGLSEINGEYYQYRLPTEAEWEYAARAGSTTAFADDIDSTVYDPTIPGPDCLEEPGLDAIAWYCHNIDDIGTREVGLKAPNAWGLYDMHGNVMEWVQDSYQEHLGFDPVTDPTGPSQGTVGVCRGGHRGSRSWDVRAASRDALALAASGSARGFRLVRNADRIWLP